MSQDTPTNGRVTNAVLLTRFDHMADLQLVMTAALEDIRQKQGEILQAGAVNEERWRNHDKAQGQYVAVHEKLHQRERGVLGTLILVATGVSGSVSAWWNGR